MGYLRRLTRTPAIAAVENLSLVCPDRFAQSIRFYVGDEFIELAALHERD